MFDGSVFIRQLIHELNRRRIQPVTVCEDDLDDLGADGTVGVAARREEGHEAPVGDVTGTRT